jgi:hypothetical protein
MSFYNKYEDAVRSVIAKSQFEVYSGKYPALIVPGKLNKQIVSLEKNLVKGTPYILLPKRDLIRYSKTMNAEYLDSKVLSIAEVCKPIVNYFIDKEVLKGFELDDTLVKVALKYHPKFRMDKTPQKQHTDEVSYMHFIDMLKTLERHPFDKFV